MNITINKNADPPRVVGIITIEVAPPAPQTSQAVNPEPEPENDPQVS